MNDHATIQEQIATYLADGLTATQHITFDAHIKDCAECARMLADSRSTDKALQALFAPLRPTATLEDRIVRSLRNVEAKPHERRTRWARYVAYGLAASVSVGAVSLGGQQLLQNGGMPFPGSEAARNDVAFAKAPAPGSVNFWREAPQSSVANFNDHYMMVPGSTPKFGRESGRNTNGLFNPDAGLDSVLDAEIDAKTLDKAEVPKLHVEAQVGVTDERGLSESKGFAPSHYRFGELGKNVRGKDDVRLFDRSDQDGDRIEKKLAEREKTTLLGRNDAKPLR